MDRYWLEFLTGFKKGLEYRMNGIIAKLQERVHAAERLLAQYEVAARKFTNKVDKGLAHSKETYADLIECRTNLYDHKDKYKNDDSPYIVFRFDQAHADDLKAKDEELKQKDAQIEGLKFQVEALRGLEHYLSEEIVKKNKEIGDLSNWANNSYAGAKSLIEQQNKEIDDLRNSSKTCDEAVEKVGAQAFEIHQLKEDIAYHKRLSDAWRVSYNQLEQVIKKVGELVAGYKNGKGN